MPSATFLVHLTIDDVSPSVLLDIAEELTDDLASAGHEVESVAPWTRPTQTMMTGIPAQPFSLPVQPPPEVPPNLFS